jgi:hypothetical protein
MSGVTMYCTDAEMNKLREQFNGCEFVELFGRAFFISRMSILPYVRYGLDSGKYEVVLELIETHKIEKVKTEKQIQLEQAIQYHKQVIEHNERMIAKYEEELKNEG